MKFTRNFMRRSLALLLTLALVVPTSALAADDGGDVITGEPASIETDAAGTPKMLDDDEAASTSTVNYSVTYDQTSARSILDMVNDFRQSSEAWYWNEDDVTKTDLEGQLSNYTYDYDLEKVAMQRAAEIAIYYSHTRPDGNTCWTAYSDMDYSCTARAENIAAGYSTADAVFEGWREDNDYYDGQGHRRNMLSSTYTAIGIACVKYNGCYYWVQEFSNNVNNSSSTSVNDNETDVSAKVAIDEVTSSELFASPDSYIMSIGGTDSLPTISGTIILAETYTGKSNKNCSITSVDATWSSTDSSIANVSGDTVTGLKSGETTLTASALDKNFSVPVSVAMISGATVTLSEDSYTYDGSEKKPDVTVQFGSATLTLDKDYTVTYSNNINAGTATVTVTGTGDYEGSQTVDFTINKASQTLEAYLADDSITVGNTTSITANGEGSISYTSSDTSIATVDNDGKITGVGVGTAKITVTADGNDNYKPSSTELSIKVIKADQVLIVSIEADSIKVGGTTTISATALDDAKISYVSGDDNIATVDSDGLVIGVGTGDTTIKVTADETGNYESASGTVDITVTQGDQKLEVSMESSSIKVGGTTTISATALDNAEISYESSDTSVATINESGVVTGVGKGTAKITVTAKETDNYESASETVDIMVTQGDQKLEVSMESSSIKVGGTTTIIATALDNAEISYESSDTSVATVNESGVVTGVGKGTAKITVTAKETDNYVLASEELSITVTKESQELTASLASSSILVGGTATITASAEEKISYASSNTSVATVDEDGVVTGVGAGTATITVTAEETETHESASKTFTITVTKANQTITASIASSSIVAGKTTTITASGKGTISYKSSNTSVATVSSSGVVTGVGAGTATITVTAAGNDSYNSASKTLSITVTKASQTLTANAKSSTIVVGKTTTITVSGKGTITYSSGDKKIATVSSSGKVTAKAPGKVTITVKAAGTSAYNSASKKVTIKVNPKAAKLSSVKNSSSKKATVKWKKVSGVTGYQIQYATNSGFTKNKKSATVKGASKISKTLTKLKKGKTYYVRIRSYKTVSGTKYYSSWSSAKKVKIKK